MIAQAWIAIFGVAAIWLSQDEREHVRRWACICGLVAQPAWFLVTWSAGQYGMFALCFAYSYAWFKGVRTYWWRVKA
jgi:hypothetical protein